MLVTDLIPFENLTIAAWIIPTARQTDGDIFFLTLLHLFPHKILNVLHDQTKSGESCDSVVKTFPHAPAGRQFIIMLCI